MNRTTMNLKNIIILNIILLLIGCENKSENQSIEKIRIISLSPHITEIIYALDAEDELIAVTDFCNYPPQAKLKSRIGGLINPNIEKIVSLKPTHLFGIPSHNNLNNELNKFGLQIIMMPNENINDIISTIEQIGEAIDKVHSAAKLNERISESLSKAKTNSKNKNTISAMLIIGREKGTLRNIIVAGADTFLDEMWQITGGRNIFSDLPSRYGSVSLEEILTRNPDVILEFIVNETPKLTRLSKINEWDLLNNINAVKNKNIFQISGSHTLIPGPRLGLLANDMAAVIKMLQ